MAACPPNVIWDKVKENSKLCAEASAVASGGATPSNDFNATLTIALADGSVVTWSKADLSPGPKKMSLTEGAYGADGSINSGPNGPTVTLHVWIEAPDNSKPFDCTWTNASAGTQKDVKIIMTVVKAVAS